MVWHKRLSGYLIEQGWKSNSYDECTYNKTIDGAQATLRCFVDDCNISHRDKNVVLEIMRELNQEFGTTAKQVTMNTGLIHEYLGLTLDYSVKGKVIFTMYDFIEDILNEVPDDMGGTKPTPAKSNLFTIDDTSEPLDTKASEFFHRTTARLLYAAKRVRPDLQLVVSFLCTRVKRPTVQDYAKLTRAIQYLRGTLELPLILGTDGSGTLRWSVDASFAVHKDMRSHSGAVLTMGSGTRIAASTKQKINTKSSTESEIVAVNDAMNMIEWVQLYVQCQAEASPKDTGIHTLSKQSIVEQDNTSSIKLKKNGKRSSSKRTRHIDIRYFYITSKVKDGSILIEYCPTEEIRADFMTKAIQGSLFQKHRNTIMGITDKAIALGEYKKYYQSIRYEQ